MTKKNNFKIPLVDDMRYIFFRSFLALNIIWLTLSARADVETCVACNGQIRIDGQFIHDHFDANAPIHGAAPGNEAAFREEIAGVNFTVTVSNLPAGKYTVVIGEAETFFKKPGRRLFKVTCGGTTLAKDFDIITAARGADKVCMITGEVEHLDESIHGPLAVTFIANKNNAKFNTFEIRDASGAPVIAFNASDLADPFTAASRQPPVVNGPEIWKDPSQPLEARVHDLMRRMSLAEKVRQISAGTPAIPRLGIPAYHFGNEALHGLCSPGAATDFPQVIGMAATWDPALIQEEGDVISTEARAKHNDYAARHQGDSGHFYGLTFWAPNINIFRDPRWGRGQETYGEDPFLTAQMALAFIRGMQGDNPKYVKAMACVKHFAVHSGPEAIRFRFDAEPSERDLYETYLPAFQAAVQQGHVGGVMGAYTSLYGVPDCASQFLLTRLLRKQWGFDGYVVSDCGAIYYNWIQRKYAPTLEESAADGIKAGCDICCGGGYDTLLTAVQKGLVSEPEIDDALYYALKTRFRLGLFDPPDLVPWSNIGIDQNDTPAHEALALKVAEESIVLLKNDGVLPLNRAKIKRLAVIGENATSVLALTGNYNGTPARPVRILDGIREIAGTNVEVNYEPGCPLALKNDNSNKPGPEMMARAMAAAQSADAVIYVGGLRPIVDVNPEPKQESVAEGNDDSQQLEGEQHQENYQGFQSGDRTRIELPPPQEDLLKALYATGKPVILVNCSGSAMAVPWEATHLPAIVQAWYPGEQGGKAVAEVLFGDVNPAGRLPLTFYASTADLPPFEDYSMSNRTYRYFTGKPLYAFGYGLSYTKFKYSRASLSNEKVNASDTLHLVFTVKNTGQCDGDEVAQVYFRHVNSVVPQPKLALCGFTRIHLTKGDKTRVAVDIPAQRLRYWDTATKQYIVEPGKYELLIGPASDDISLELPLQLVAR